MKNYFLHIVTVTMMSVSTIFAQTYQSGTVVISNGQGTITSTSYTSQNTIGQSAIGVMSSTSFSTTAGFIPTTLSVVLLDVAVSNAVADPTIVAIGNDVSFSVTIQSNENGGINANTLEIAIYLSTDEIIDTGELLKTVTVTNSIAGNSTYIFPQTEDDNQVTIPAGTTPNSYYLIIELDPSGALNEVLENNNVITTAITVSDDAIDPVIGTVSNDLYFSAGAEASVAVNDNSGVDRVNFYHRGIRSAPSDDWGTPVEVSINAGLYTLALEASWLDELGVEFWFEAFDTSNNRDSTNVKYMYSKTVGSELTLPPLAAGRNQANYQMISIPFDLTQKNVSSIFSKLGEYDPSTWRMYHYLNGSTKEYNQGWSTIESGKSYWIIHDVANVGQILIDEGEAIQGNKATPYTIDLIQGWNQIGNPYRFDINWSDVLDASGNPTEVELFRVWSSGKFRDGNILANFSGGFVFTNAPVTISIPVTSTGTGGRVAGVTQEDNPLDNASWQVNYSLTNNDITFNLGGFGMHPEALVEKDIHDKVSMPRLPQYVDLNFSHTEYFISKFSKDVVPSTEEFTWYFTIDKKSDNQATTLTWDNNYFGHNNKQLVMVDLERNAPISMREESSYSFLMADSYRFKIIYGDQTYVDQELITKEIVLNQNYPNPFTSSTIIPFSLPNSYDFYDVDLIIVNKLGQEVKHLLKTNLTAGFYEIEWNGEAQSGQKVVPGLYIYKLSVNTGEELLTYTKNIIIY